MHDIKSNTLTECELAEIHGGASYMDAQGRVHSGSSGFPDSITLPDGTVLQMLPLNATPPQAAAAIGQAVAHGIKKTSALFTSFAR